MNVRNVSIFTIALALLVFAVAGFGLAVAAAPAETVAAGESCAVGAKACGKCGDGTCVPQCGETAQSCPADCGVEASMSFCGKCGDGACVPQCGETPESCPRDCGVEAVSLFGDL